MDYVRRTRIKRKPITSYKLRLKPVPNIYIEGQVNQEMLNSKPFAATQAVAKIANDCALRHCILVGKIAIVLSPECLNIYVRNFVVCPTVLLRCPQNVRLPILSNVTFCEV